VSSGTVCKELLDKAAAAAITVLKTGRVSKMARLIASKLTPQISLHGVLVEIFGLGTSLSVRAPLARAKLHLIVFEAISLLPMTWSSLKRPAMK
jgi:serine kinase of HPr protein (carbohydrate metabolism regulator)